MSAATKSLTYGAGASFLVLTLLSPRSQRARMYLNALLYIASMGACSFFGVAISPFMALTKNALNINWAVARAFHLLAGNLIGLKFKVEGEEKFDQARPAVLVGNHQTGVDILYLGRIFPKHASIMAKQILKFTPLLGQFMYLAGAVFIDRANRASSIKAFDKVSRKMKKYNLSLWVFPEGTRSNLPFPDLLPFKKGAFHLAVQAQVPIVPVVCENYNRFFDGKTRFEAGTVRVRVLDPIETKGLKMEDVTELTTRVRSVMLAELQKMDAELERGDVSSAIKGKPKPLQLGGLAKLASYIVGVGSGPDVVGKVERERKELVKPGTSGEKVGDFNLVSEKGKGKATAVAGSTTDAVQRPNFETKTSGSHSSEETDESAILVKRP